MLVATTVGGGSGVSVGGPGVGVSCKNTAGTNERAAGVGLGDGAGGVLVTSGPAASSEVTGGI